MVQTAEGALDEVSSILLRLRELAQQSLTGTLTDTERGYLDAEYQDLLEEIDRISDTTEFNGVTLLDGTLVVNIQVGIGTATADSIAIAQSRVAKGIPMAVQRARSSDTSSTAMFRGSAHAWCSTTRLATAPAAPGDGRPRKTR